MGYYNLSSSPLSTLLPLQSPYKMPDYSNAFKNNMQTSMNNTLFRQGLMLSGSNNYATSLEGLNMVNNAINFNNPHEANLPQLGFKVDWDSGLNMLGQLGSLIGGLAGNVLTGASKIGSNIRLVNLASKMKNLNAALLKLAKAAGIAGAVGAGTDLIGSFMPLKTEYSGDKGNMTLTLDSVYDGISDAAMAFGPFGMIAGGVMKGAALLGKGINALGGGTSGMTTTDAILGSSFLLLTPLGLVNGFGGRNTDTITKDSELFSQIGSSYTGSESAVDDALLKSGKKYGLLSSGARRKANQQIQEAKRLLNIMTDIADEASNRFDIRNSTSAINGNRYGLDLLGGYNLSAIRIGRHGMSLLDRARQITKALKGQKLPYKVWIRDVNPDYLSKYYDLETAYNYVPIEQLNKWKAAVNSKNPNYYMDYRDKNGNYPYHLPSIAPILGTEDYIFLKKGRENENPELHWETDTYYNGSNGLKDTHDLVYENDRYYYRKKKPITSKYRNGGSVITLVKESIIELVNPNEVPEFLNGGSINVIPDGALHARKHNMDLEGITPKGIPVISEKDNGKVEQLAEIEKEEVIFRLEVTQKLEELEKKYYSEETSLKEKDEYALEAGKLITEELLHNTKDNAGLL